MRWDEANINACRECEAIGGNCATRTECKDLRQPLRPYGGIRFTSDGFDCALPVSIDSHSGCSYGCLYCFADQIRHLSRRESREGRVGQTRLSQVRRLFSGDTKNKQLLAMRRALKYDALTKAQPYPCPVQVGATTDPCDTIERQQGWLRGLLELAWEYNQPLRISTKGVVLMEQDYLSRLRERPELVWVAFSFTTLDDELAAVVEAGAPSPTERLRCMARLSSIGVTTSLRFRPLLPGLADRTPRWPRAWEALIDRAADCGARAVSYEAAFVPGHAGKALRAKWARLGKALNVDFYAVYRAMGKAIACMRPGHRWTEGIMHAIRERADKHNLWVGVSDPVWKQLTQYGCCCGIPPDHPVFGNWQRENATMALVHARDTGALIRFADSCPEWAADVRKDVILPFGAGPHNLVRSRHETWEDNLRGLWNNVDHERGPYRYFQGALEPAGRDANGDRLYRYVGLKRGNPDPVPYWRVGREWE